MRFKVNGEAFCSIATTVTRALSTRDPEAQTTFKIEDDKLFIQCRTQTSFFKGNVSLLDIEAEDNETREWLVSGEQLVTILSILSNYKDKLSISFNMSDSQRIFEVVYQTTKLKLPVEEAPTFAQNEEIRKIAEIDGIEFVHNLTRLSRVCESTMSIDHSASCVQVFINDTTLTMVGTDTIALAEIKQNLSQSFLTGEKLIKPSQANLICQNRDINVITLVETDTMFGYTDDNDTLLLIATTDLTPLDYLGIKDMTSSEQSLKFNRDNFKFVVDSLARLCNTSDTIYFTLADNRLIAENENKDRFEISVEGEFENTSMNMSYKSLSNIFGLMTDNVKLGWKNVQSLRALKFTCVDSEDVENENIFISIVETYYANR